MLRPNSTSTDKARNKTRVGYNKQKPIKNFPRKKKSDAFMKLNF